jgi:hypothetical protein
MWGSVGNGEISLGTHGTQMEKTVKTLLERATPVVPEDFQNHPAPAFGISSAEGLNIGLLSCWRGEAANICWVH